MYHLAFPLSPAVIERTFAIIDQLTVAERPRDHVNELTDTIIAMTEEGLAYLFIDSLKEANVSPIHIKAVQVGVNTARKGLEVIGRRALKMMSDENLRGIARYMEKIIVHVEASE